MNSSKHVFIKQEGISALAKTLLQQMKEDQHALQFKSWKTHPLNPKVANEQALDWIFVVDALNFSFWTPSNDVKFMVRYGNEEHTGYWSLCAAVNRALDDGVPITSAEYCKNITEAQAAHIFRSDSQTEIPMLKERVTVLRDIGSVLMDEFGGKFANCVTRANGCAQALMRLIVNHFPCFKDEGLFNGQQVSFYKRAQILVADTWACFEGIGHGHFVDIDTITMFADYRIPQTLVYFGAISYSDQLMKLLEDDHMFNSGDVMEMEIRAGSIWAVELLAVEMNKLMLNDPELIGRKVNAILLDHYLWDYRRAHDDKTRHIPYHKIRCIFY